jgi:polyphosphate kinase 2 (PPK2 family)
MSWKQSIRERRYWAEYETAYAEAIKRCSTAAAPWNVVPANRKWCRGWAVSRILIETMEEMKLTFLNPNLGARALRKSLQAAA